MCWLSYRAVFNTWSACPGFWPGMRTGRTGRDGRTGRTGRTDGRAGRDGRTGRTGRTDGRNTVYSSTGAQNTVYSSTGTEKYSFTADFFFPGLTHPASCVNAGRGAKGPTVATYDKKLHFLVRESQNFLDFWSEFWPDFWPDFWPGFWPGFWEGKIQEIQCTVLPDPKEKYKKFRKFRVSISYRRISYRMSPPYENSRNPRKNWQKLTKAMVETYDKKSYDKKSGPWIS